MSSDTDVISAVKNTRRLIVTLDSFGFPLEDLLKDEEISKCIPRNLYKEINTVATKIHKTLQCIEKSKRYKEIASNIIKNRFGG